MPMEVEIKLRVPDGRVAARMAEDERVRGYLMTDFRDADMDAVYYDTVDGALEQRQWAYRIRREGALSVACCKAAESKDGAVFSRREWQVPGEPPETALLRLVETGAPEALLSFGELLPQCAIVFTRRFAPLRLSDDTHAEMAIDSGCLTAGDKQEDFWELELELLSGNLAEMREFAEYLEKKYTLAAEHLSKYARALRLIRTR